MQHITDEKHVIFWFRRDLRLKDNAGLYHALKSGFKVVPIFIFDTDILRHLPKDDARVTFIHHALVDLNHQLNQLGSGLSVFHNTPAQTFAHLLKNPACQGVYTNTDYEPYATSRDTAISDLCKQHQVPFLSFKDHVFFEKNEVVKANGEPYTVFTPYSKVWKEKLNDFYRSQYPTEKYLHALCSLPKQEILSLQAIGFEESNTSFPEAKIPVKTIESYHQFRDIPSVAGTTKLSVHLRFGTVSIRRLVQVSLAKNEKWLSELIWRDFYQAILFHFPTSVNQAFKPQYDRIVWRNSETEFLAWCRGETGYPIVDAGMRELNQTGFMHNRVRMIVASFLTKHLLIDWRWGERYFAEKLLDFDLASNVGGWQWAASSGCDAAPYFRVFNPELQTQKFDPQLKYIKHWIPELTTPSYPQPIVNHKFARERVLKVYKEALSE